MRVGFCLCFVCGMCLVLIFSFGLVVLFGFFLFDLLSFLLCCFVLFGEDDLGGVLHSSQEHFGFGENEMCGLECVPK